jgi:hypothetical protein
MAHECVYAGGIRDVTPSALGCEECLKIGSPWVHALVGRVISSLGSLIVLLNIASPSTRFRCLASCSRSASSSTPSSDPDDHGSRVGTSDLMSLLRRYRGSIVFPGDAVGSERSDGA